VGWLAGYRITARALEQRLVSDEILRELNGLEEVKAVEEEAIPPVAGKVVFVLEDEESDLPEAPKMPR
jgi:hypothetical protein